MKILYFGLESQNWIIYLMNELANLGNEITVFTQSNDDYDNSIKIEKNKNITHHIISHDNVINPNEFKQYHFDKIKNKKFDIIIGSHLPSTPLVYNLSKILNIPCVEMLLDIPTDLINIDSKRKNMWNVGFDYLRQFNSVIFNTTIARDEYERFTGIKYPDENIIFYGIDTKIADTIKEQEEENFVVTISRLHPQKRIHHVIEALGKLKNPPKYVCIGRDSIGFLPYLNKRARELNVNFNHLGLISEKEKWEYIKKCKVLLYPQATEYIGGLSPFEAFYGNKRAIVANTNVLKELYADNAIYFEKNNIESLSSAIKETLQKKDTKEEQQKRKHWTKENATFPIMAQKMNNIFQEVIIKNE